MLEGGADRAQQTTGANFGTQQTQLIFARHGKLDVVYAHDLHALRVDNLLVEHVAREQEFGRLQVRKTDFGGRRLKVYTRLIDTVDHLRQLIINGVLPGPRNASDVTCGKTSPVAMPKSFTTPSFSPSTSKTGSLSISLR